eukprot:gb/GECH01013620.1/.p1 GENE.gb/GECH01013620.1/~~gb/GECH01013620.1/.p1  ORF type:complete len:349 (+),score=92.69 gb/GECH01013620.1/:1-1047(+)
MSKRAKLLFKPKPPKVSAAAAQDSASHKGWFTKQGGRHRTWKKRFCVLKDEKLYWFKNEKANEPQGYLEIGGLFAYAGEECGKSNAFKIVHPKRTYYAFSDTKKQCDDWIDAINEEASKKGSRMYVVDALSQEGGYHKISDAVQEASDGDQIHIRPAQYQESVRVEKSLEFYGVLQEKMMTPRIESLTESPVICSGDSKIRMEDMHLQQKQSDAIDCFDVSSTELALKNCDITSEGGNGVMLYKAVVVRIEDCRIHDCRCSGIHGGEYASGEILSCTVSRCGWDGVRLDGEAAFIIRHNTLDGHQGNGVKVASTAANTIEGNRFFRNMRDPLRVEEDAEPNCSNNRFE